MPNHVQMIHWAFVLEYFLSVLPVLAVHAKLRDVEKACSLCQGNTMALDGGLQIFWRDLTLRYLQPKNKALC